MGGFGRLKPSWQAGPLTCSTAETTGFVANTVTATANFATNTAASATATATPVSNDTIIPSTEFLRSDRAIQQQVDARFLKLQGAANLLTWVVYLSKIGHMAPSLYLGGQGQKTYNL